MLKKLVKNARLLITLAVTVFIAVGAVLTVKAIDGYLRIGKEKKANLSPQNVSFRQTVRIWVHGDRVSPDVIYARPGMILLEAENETSTAISLKFERKIPGQPPHLQSLVRAAKMSKRASQEVSLAAGEYVFYDEARPAIKGKLIVDQQLR